MEEKGKRSNVDADKLPMIPCADNAYHSSKYANHLKWLSHAFFMLGGIFYMMSAAIDVSNNNNNVTEVATSLIVVRVLSGFGYFMSGIADLFFCALSEDAPTTTNNFGCRKLNHHEVVALILTVAGALDMASGIFSTKQNLSDSLGIVSAHFYFLEASVALFGLTCCYQLFHEEHNQSSFPEHNIFFVYFLHRSGDLLFFTGSLIDLVTSYFYLSSSDSIEIDVTYSTLASSVLWTIDALLYISGDLIAEIEQLKSTNNTNTIPINKEIELC